jgi:CRP/FNR family cyclic AMP-dependent transcriptional regulator
VSADLLAQVPLFAEVPRRELEEMAASLRRRRYARGQVLFTQGDPGDILFVVESGRVNMVVGSSDGKELVLNSFGPGESFGELAVLDGEPRSTDAVVVEAGYLHQLRRDDLMRCVRARPEVAAAMIGVLVRKLRHTSQQAYDVAFLDVPARLARCLLRLADSAGEPLPGGGLRIGRRLTQTELGGLIGATRESVNKWLRQFERQGLIRSQGGTIAVLEADGLRRRVY